MIVEVVQRMATDPAKVHQLLDRWAVDVAPHAPGWRDTTAGVAADGRFVAMIRFDSAAAPIQGHDQWRAETMAVLNGDRSHLVYDRSSSAAPDRGRGPPAATSGRSSWNPHPRMRRHLDHALGRSRSTTRLHFAASNSGSVSAI